MNWVGVASSFNDGKYRCSGSPEDSSESGCIFVFFVFLLQVLERGLFRVRLCFVFVVFLCQVLERGRSSINKYPSIGSSISRNPSALPLGIPIGVLQGGVNARCITAVSPAKHINISSSKQSIEKSISRNTYDILSISLSFVTLW